MCASSSNLKSGTALDNDNSEKTVGVESSRVGSSQFTIQANRIGKFKLTLTARMDGVGGETRNDIVVREIEVVPNGREQNLVFNGRLETSAQHDLRFPRTRSLMPPPCSFASIPGRSARSSRVWTAS